MKQSGYQSERNDKPEVSAKNRVRLIQQNKKLLIEVYKLESIINSILEKSVSNEFQIEEGHQEVKQKYKEEIEQQLKNIARLKKEIKKVKANLADHRYQEVKKEQNQVVFLKKQYEKLMKQRDTMQKKKNEKQQALEFHKPINNQTAETYEHYKKVKAQNGQLKLKIHNIQKQVAKYHKYKELAKNSAPRLYDNPDYQFMKIDNEIRQMRKEMKRIEDKWKSKVESLNRQYFSFRNIFAQKEAEIQNLQKEARNWENKMNSKRDENLVASDRQRISSVPISPQKRKEIQDLIEQQKKKLKRLEPKSNINKSKNQKPKTDSLKAPVDKGLPVVMEVAVQTEKPSEQLKIETQVKMEQQESKVSNQKPKKMVESVGVGTSFYYSDD